MNANRSARATPIICWLARGLTVVVMLFSVPVGAQVDTVASGGSHIVDASRVVPVIRSAKDINRLSNEVRQHLALRPLTPELFVLIAEDTPGAILYLTTEQVAQLGWTAEDEKVKSIINLAKILPRFQIRGSQGFYMIIAGGNYEASMLVATPLWGKLGKELKGEAVVGIPNRDLFFVTGTQDQEGLKRLRTVVADSYAHGDHPLSDKLFMVNQEGISIFP